MNKSLNWYFRRHPLLYSVRFRLVSKKASLKALEHFNYNEINKKSSIPKLYWEINNLIFDKNNLDLNDLDKARTIAIWLRNNIKGGPGLGNSSRIALQKMIDGKGGVCSDFSQIFNNFCVINDLKVREWGMKNLSTDGSVSGGHSYNEVHCATFQKWVMIDVARGLLFYQTDQDTPLSSIEYIRLKKEKKEIIISSINNSKLTDIEHIHKIYISSVSKPFIISNYNNKFIDNLLEKLDFFPVSIIHGLITISGKGYRFEFPDDNN